MKPSKPYEESLYESLKDPKVALEYLRTAMEDPDRKVFLLALKDVARARGGLQSLAKEAHLNRENLYRTLSRRGNPRYENLTSVVEAIGFKLTLERMPKSSKHYSLKS
ncbi:MAG: putative addiction module antidote protein [Candidatus Margulisbacteria bacterium]|nr:putative addiction module antidote protein [Candidatus Margulisiibacteriota bacterium]